VRRDPVTYRTASTVLAGLFATVAGALLALWLRYIGPGHHAELSAPIQI
jgi:ABC-type branched-subunit amino acid transport system permease subunit